MVAQRLSEALNLRLDNADVAHKPIQAGGWDGQDRMEADIGYFLSTDYTCTMALVRVTD